MRWQIKPLPRGSSRTQAFILAVESDYSGVKAAETGESNAQGRWGRARDGTVGVAQYVVTPPYRAGRVMSMEVITINGLSP